MVPSNGVARAAEPPAVDGEALEFVRFCHRRKHVGWPELYDEMCRVAGRGLYHGCHADDLAEIGIAFGLLDMPALAILVSRVVAEDQERRRRAAETTPPALVVEAAAEPVEESAPGAVAGLPVTVMVPSAPNLTGHPDPVERTGPDHGSIRIAVAAGA
jgi:hypothetical protein